MGGAAAATAAATAGVVAVEQNSEEPDAELDERRPLASATAAASRPISRMQPLVGDDAGSGKGERRQLPRLQGEGGGAFDGRASTPPCAGGDNNGGGRQLRPPPRFSMRAAAATEPEPQIARRPLPTPNLAAAAGGGRNDRPMAVRGGGRRSATPPRSLPKPVAC